MATTKQMLKGPEGSTISLQTDGGSVTVSRDSNCSLGPASQGPGGPPGMAPMGMAPMGAGGMMPMVGPPQGAGMQFNSVPGQAMSPQECAALGLPPGTKWAGGSRPSGEAPYPSGGSNAGESFLSI